MFAIRIHKIRQYEDRYSKRIYSKFNCYQKAIFGIDFINVETYCVQKQSTNDDSFLDDLQ